jgi:hypothetical protein
MLLRLGVGFRKTFLHLPWKKSDIVCFEFAMFSLTMSMVGLEKTRSISSRVLSLVSGMKLWVKTTISIFLNKENASVYVEIAAEPPLVSSTQCELQCRW